MKKIKKLHGKCLNNQNIAIYLFNKCVFNTSFF